MTKEERLAILERHVRELSEIFDSVQILAAWLNPDGTTSSQKRGGGDWYSRQGLAHEFIQENIADDAAMKIAEKLEPPPEDWEGKEA